MVAIGCAAVLGLGACGGGDDDDAASTTTKPFGVRPTTESMSAKDAKRIDDAAQAAFTSLGAKSPGLYVGVWDPKKGFFTKAYGLAEVGGTKATVDDSLRIGSMTDTYTATVILQLVREAQAHARRDRRDVCTRARRAVPRARGDHGPATALDGVGNP